MKALKVDNADDLKAFTVTSNELNIATVCYVAKCLLAQMAHEIGLLRKLCQVSSKSVTVGSYTAIITNY
jgi:hypothetical protein